MKRVAALALVLAACSGAQSSGAPAAALTPRDYFPLHLHAAWSFDSDDVDHPGSSGLITMTVVRDDGAGGFYMQQGHGAPAMYEYANGGVSRNGELVIGGPIAAGTRWQGTRSHDGYVIERVGLTRTVPAGTFHDVIEVVRVANEAGLHGTEYRETYYYAPHVGLVEGLVPIMLESGDVRRYRLVLRGYTLTGDL